MTTNTTPSRATGAATSGAGPGVADPVIHKKVPWPEYLGWAILALFVVVFVHNLFTNPNWKWPIVREYLFNPLVLEGLGNTIKLTIVSGITGTLFGLLIAMMRLSSSPILRTVSTAFIGFMRAMPALVLLLLIYFSGALFPTVPIGIPITGPTFGELPVNQIITQFIAAWLGLTLIMGSHTGEIFRGGVISVHGGQLEAAKALGLPPFQAFVRIVLPQAIRVSIPGLANELISLFKNTSLVSIIGYAELLTVVQAIYGRTYQTIPLLIVAVIWYLVLILISMAGQRQLEKRFGRGFTRGAHA